ncbi:MAG: succinate dehydrogenase, cytochrome b556 subunit [Burkholderiales bacterium]|nr:succinate dehydrogenase, cytochrome b556 subunit [Burkholderiales bacterium]
MQSSMIKTRPKYLDVSKIRLPLPALVSILHRISGFGLFLFLPFLLYLLHASLASPDSYVRYRGVIEQPLVKLILLGLLWAYLHHLLAGIRFLLLDVHCGVELQAARRSSRIVLAGSLLLTLILGVFLW